MSWQRAVCQLDKRASLLHEDGDSTVTRDAITQTNTVRTCKVSTSFTSKVTTSTPRPLLLLPTFLKLLKFKFPVNDTQLVNPYPTQDVQRLNGKAPAVAAWQLYQRSENWRGSSANASLLVAKDTGLYPWSSAIITYSNQNNSSCN